MHSKKKVTWESSQPSIVPWTLLKATLNTEVGIAPKRCWAWLKKWKKLRLSQGDNLEVFVLMQDICILIIDIKCKLNKRFCFFFFQKSGELVKRIKCLPYTQWFEFDPWHHVSSIMPIRSDTLAQMSVAPKTK